jgi:transposase, IS30 family
VSRGAAANGGREDYRAWRAHRRAAERARPAQMAHGPLVAKETEWLEEWWSPEQIANRLRSDFPDDPIMWMSHERIYKSLFLQGGGELRQELHRCLLLDGPSGADTPASKIPEALFSTRS